MINFISTPVKRYDPGNHSIDDVGGPENALKIMVNDEHLDGIPRGFARHVLKQTLSLAKRLPATEVEKWWRDAIIYAHAYAFTYLDYAVDHENMQVCIRNSLIEDQEDHLQIAVDNYRKSRKEFYDAHKLIEPYARALNKAVASYAKRS